MKPNETASEWVDFVVTARKYKTKCTAKYLARKRWEKPVAGEVLALLPGTILSVSVKPGNTVKAGDVLLMQESMKMHNRVLAPVSGKVTEVRVSQGDRVPKDFLMVKIK